jgi:hypothetical protein
MVRTIFFIRYARGRVRYGLNLMPLTILTVLTPVAATPAEWGPSEAPPWNTTRDRT